MLTGDAAEELDVMYPLYRDPGGGLGAATWRR